MAGLFLMAVSTVGFGLTGNPKLLFLFSLAHGVGEGFLLAAVMSMIDILSSYHSKERISGVKVFAGSTGFFVGPLAAGVATAALGFQSSFIYLGLITLALSLLTISIPFKIRAHQ